MGKGLADGSTPTLWIFSSFFPGDFFDVHAGSSRWRRRNAVLAVIRLTAETEFVGDIQSFFDEYHVTVSQLRPFAWFSGCCQSSGWRGRALRPGFSRLDATCLCRGHLRGLRFDDLVTLPPSSCAAATASSAFFARMLRGVSTPYARKSAFAGYPCRFIGLCPLLDVFEGLYGQW